MKSEQPYRTTPHKDWPEERKERHRASERKWRKANREKALADKRKREAVYRQSPEYAIRKAASDKAGWLKYRHSEKWVRTRRRAHWKRKYGITPEQYDQMLQDHGGVCAICKRPETAGRNGRIKLLSVDHNHTTKELRGLLCDQCNKALGCVQDSVERLQSAIDYLNQYSKGDSN